MRRRENEIYGNGNPIDGYAVIAMRSSGTGGESRLCRG